jgi:hypothetical protein
MGALRYLQRELKVRREARVSAQAPTDTEEFRPTIPGGSPASAVRRFSQAAFVTLDRRERESFRRRGFWTTDTELHVYRQSGRLRVAELKPGVTPAQAYAASQRLVVELCERTGIEYFLVPESWSSRARIGIEDRQWQKFVDALVDLGQSNPTYGAVDGVTSAGRRRRYSELVTDARLVRAMRTQRHIEVFRPYLPDREARVAFDRPFGCHVERWTSEEGGLRAPSRNERTTFIGSRSRVPATTWSRGQTVRTLRPFTSVGMFDIDFPIDVVYMWVDGADPLWVERKNEALRLAGRQAVDAATSPERFRDHGELRYSMRSVEQFAPWVRNIYLVTDQQVPRWLDPEHPRITVVDQREIFGGEGAVPNFNSHAIGARLHHIHGLSDYYLHFNDDFFLARPVLPQLFFTSTGASKFFLSRSTLGFHDEGQAQPHEQARRNVVDLLHTDFGRAATRAFFHTPIVQRRQTMLELERRYRDAFESTWNNQFRSASDFEINSWLHHYYGYLTNAAVPGTIRYDYFDVSDDAAWRRMRRLLRTRDKDTFCINDNALATVEQWTRVEEWMAAYFERPSPWEVRGGL